MQIRQSQTPLTTPAPNFRAASATPNTRQHGESVAAARGPSPQAPTPSEMQGLAARTNGGNPIDARRVDQVQGQIMERIQLLAQETGPAAGDQLRTASTAFSHGMGRITAALADGSLSSSAAETLLAEQLAQLGDGLRGAYAAEGDQASETRSQIERLESYAEQLHARLEEAHGAGSSAARTSIARLDQHFARLFEGLKNGTLDGASLAEGIDGAEAMARLDSAPAGEPGMSAGERLDGWLDHIDDRLASFAAGSSDQDQATAAARTFLDLVQRMADANGGSLDERGTIQLFARALGQLRQELSGLGITVDSRRA